MEHSPVNSQIWNFHKPFCTLEALWSTVLGFFRSEHFINNFLLLEQYAPPLDDFSEKIVPWMHKHNLFNRVVLKKIRKSKFSKIQRPSNWRSMHGGWDSSQNLKSILVNTGFGLLDWPGALQDTLGYSRIIQDTHWLVCNRLYGLGKSTLGSLVAGL